MKAAIFDVQPHRASLKVHVNGAVSKYYEATVAIQFLRDIHTVLNEYSIMALHKRKRDIGNVLHPKYKNVLKEFSGENQIIVNPELSAYNLIEEVDFVISMPFTSTAILASEQNKPSIYYDPFGDVLIDDRAAHGIPIIIGIDALRLWVRALI